MTRKPRNHEYSTQFIINIALVAKERGWTQKELVERMGVSQSHWSGMLVRVGQHSVVLDIAYGMARGVGMSIEDLLLPRECTHEDLKVRHGQAKCMICGKVFDVTIGEEIA